MIEVRLLRPTDNRSCFSSGDPDLDRFFIRYAGQNQFRHHVGTTYVAVENDAIKGFATVSASTIEVNDLSIFCMEKTISAIPASCSSPCASGCLKTRPES